MVNGAMVRRTVLMSIMLLVAIGRNAMRFPCCFNPIEDCHDAVTMHPLIQNHCPCHELFISTVTPPILACSAGFPAAVLPGMMMASLFPAIIGSHFPGAVYLSQTLSFRSAACVGEALHASVEVTKRSGSRLCFKTVCEDSNGRILVDGTAMAVIKRLKE